MFCFCTDSTLGERRVGPWLWYVWAEGTKRCWGSFCTSLIWELNCQTQTYAGLRRTRNSNPLKYTIAVETTQPWLTHYFTFNQTKAHHALFVLFSSDSCSVCDLWKSPLTPAQHTGCVFAVFICGSCQVWQPFLGFQSIVRHPWRFGHWAWFQQNGDWWRKVFFFSMPAFCSATFEKKPVPAHCIVYSDVEGVSRIFPLQ